MVNNIESEKQLLKNGKSNTEIVQSSTVNTAGNNTDLLVNKR